ncbi:MAG: hypothetical protein HY536_01245, partial [Candidatus Colwellbacteria bacterium]|nr:hypothetical protein [Candidatus Colwellbacteria bacterium]
PLVYAAAFSEGYTPDTVVFDVATEFDTTGEPEKSYRPENYDEVFRGPVTLREALAQSINVPAVKVLYLVGLADALGVAADLGLSTLTDIYRYGLSLVLGGGEVRLIELVGAYATFAQDGVRHDQNLVLKVSAKSKVFEEYEDSSQRVIDAQSARLINDILSDTTSRKPLFKNSFNLTVVPGHDIALKTGTTDDYRDAWAIGYTPRLAVGVWAGNNDNTPMQQQGGSILAALPMWHAFMREALGDYAPVAFKNPEPILTEKPVLNGEHVSGYSVGGAVLPHVHSILHYVVKDDPRAAPPADPASDPQYENWEEPVLAWAGAAYPDFASAFNAPVSAGTPVVSTAGAPGGGGPISIAVAAPLTGTFVAGPTALEATLTTTSEKILKVSLVLNGSVIDVREGDLGKTYHYTTTVPGAMLQLQNKIVISVSDSGGNETTESVIVFTKI